MALTPARKTYSQLTAATDVQDSDLLASYRSTGPLKKITASTLKTYFQTGVALSATLAASGGSALIGFIQSGTGAVARTLQSKNRDIISVIDFGAVGDGATDDSAAFNAACALGAVTGTSVLIPPGKTYMMGAQWEIDCSLMTGSRMMVMAYGAEIKSSHVGSALKITGRSTPNGITVAGLKINHRGNATASAGIELTATDHAHIIDPVIEMHGVSATYKPYWLHNEDPANDDTGCFWTTITNLSLRRRSGGDPGIASYGVYLQGAANATTIRGGSLGSCTAGVYVTVESGYNYVPNALIIDGVAFEGVGVGVDVVGTTTGTIGGLRVVNSRFETCTTACARFTGTSLSSGVPPFFAGNYATPEVPAYILNTNAIRINTLDCWTNPAIANPSLVSTGGMTIESTSGSATPLKVVTGGGERGILLDAFGTTPLGGWLWAGVSNEAVFRGAGAFKLNLAGIKGISASSTTYANNLRGSVTLSGGTGSVVFSEAEANTAYFITLAGNAAETFSWASKATGGFTINSSNASSTATVDWHIIR